MSIGLRGSLRPCAARSVFAALGCVLASAACGDGIGTPIRRAALEEADASIDQDAAVDGGAGIGGAGGFGGGFAGFGGGPGHGFQQPWRDDVPANNPYCMLAAAWPQEWVDVELSMYDLIRQIRSSGEFTCQGQTYRDLQPLELVPELRCSARMHSADMARGSYVDIRDSQGTEPQTRMAAAGLQSIRDWGELVEDGRDPGSVLNQLLRNARFGCEHLGSDRFDAIGIGYADLGGQQGGDGYWTIDFAQR